MLKNDERLRLYINYKDFNLITIKNRYFLSLIIEILNCLSKAKAIIKLNLKNVYHRIRIRRDNE